MLLNQSIVVLQQLGQTTQDGVFDRGISCLFGMFVRGASGKSQRFQTTFQNVAPGNHHFQSHDVVPR